MNWKFSESFAGIGAWGKAIKRVTKRHGDTCELQWYAEIDKKASNAFSAIHGVSEDLNIWDITKDIEVKPMDIFFYSPPCQTYSVAGKREGSTVDKGNLFWNALDKIKKTMPKYAIMENVKGLPSGDTQEDFNNMIWDLEKAGYVNYWYILNTSDYCIPQNRERVFIVSIRKDIYEKGKRFEFPNKKKLNLTISDMLETEIAPKYLLSDEVVSRFKRTSLGGNIVGTTAPDFRTIGQRDLVYNSNGILGALTATDYKQPKQVMIAASRGRDITNPSDRTIGNKNLEQRLEINKDGLCNTITSVQKDNYVIIDDMIRKLTPLECFRFQGFDDIDYLMAVNSYDKTFGKNKNGTSKSDAQMYMRAGNSITVNVIEEILENLLYDRKQEGQQLSLF